MKQVILYNDVLSKEDWDTAFNVYLRRPQWRYGHTSSSVSSMGIKSPQYWIMELMTDEFFTKYIADKILDLIPVKGLKVNTVYAGANTFGTCGDLHVDSHTDTDYTFLYYASPDKWTPMYGGKTSFYPHDAPPEYYEFTPNAAIFFKSNIMHVGEPVKRYFDGLRICIAFKLTPDVDN